MKIQACDVHVHPNYDNICDRFSFFFLHVRFWREEKAIKSEGRIYFFLSFKSFFTWRPIMDMKRYINLRYIN